MSKKDAAVIKALEELGLRTTPDPSTLPDPLKDLQDQLDKCEQDLGSLTPDNVRRYVVPPE